MIESSTLLTVKNVPEKLIGIAAVAKNGVIGVNGAMPWYIPEDFAYFKRTTLGGILVMGRRTFESIGHPLPGRTNFVVSSSPRPVQFTDSKFDELYWEPTLTTALAAVRILNETLKTNVFVIGGATVFQACWQFLSDLYITEVDAAPTGDTFFPKIAANDWRETWREPHDRFAFVRYTRRTDNLKNLKKHQRK
ncbi:MAG: dihydrofolate reductase [Propionibacteriaceae bacterium]|jgi:dihydrofolate reductase|nr:dihydrofolate reductase [Propionibacteriaceae bacterium]